MEVAFDIEAIRQWPDYPAPSSRVDEHGKVFIEVPAAIWNQMLSDLSDAADEIERLDTGTSA